MTSGIGTVRKPALLVGLPECGHSGFGAGQLPVYPDLLSQEVDPIDGQPEALALP